MKEVFVDDLCGTEVLAVPVITDANVVLIQSETVLKQEYIEKLKEHNQLLVYVKEDVQVSKVNDNVAKGVKSSLLLFMVMAF